MCIGWDWIGRYQAASFPAPFHGFVTFLCADGIQEADGKGTFYIDLRDQDDCDLYGDDKLLEVQIEGPSGPINVVVDRSAKFVGRYNVEYERSEPGEYQIMVTYKEDELGGTLCV